MNTRPNDAAHASTEWCIDTGEPNYNNPGLTKREYFAAMAMQGAVASNYVFHSPQELAQYAVSTADTLIAELNK